MHTSRGSATVKIARLSRGAGARDLLARFDGILDVLRLRRAPTPAVRDTPLLYNERG